MPSAYRTSAFAAASRRVIAFGTGERLVLHLPMSPAEVIEALSRLAQPDRPSRREHKTANHRPFLGVVDALHFRLIPLRSRASMLDMHGDIQPRGSASVVTIDITLRLPVVASTIIAAVAVVAAVFACRASAGALIYYGVRVAIFLATAGVAIMTSVRFGISDVRRTIVDALERGPAASITSDG